MKPAEPPLTPSTAEPLTRLRAELQRYHREAMLIGGGSITALVLFLAGLRTGHLWHYPVLFALALAIAWRLSRLHYPVRALQAVQELNAKEAIGPLLEVETTLLPLNFAIQEKLTHLLSSLRIEYEISLTPHQLACLHEKLLGRATATRQEPDEKFLIAGLEALALIGSEKSFSVVRDLEELVRVQYRQGPVVEIAQAVLPRLKARLERERNVQTLVRAAGFPADELLRSAQGPSETDPDTLLRGSSPDS